jgi:uncharacterized protein YndB with AHSA1/START domain
MDDGFTRVFSLAHPPREVWRVLTDRDEMVAWFAPVVGDADVRPGGRITCGEKSADEVECEIVEVEPERQLRWIERGETLAGAIDITVVLEPAGDGTRVLFTEARHADAHGPDWIWKDELLEVERAVGDMRKHLAGEATSIAHAPAAGR